MNDREKRPSLRISHIVRGRESTGNRVRYLVDPDGKGSARKIPEQVVLHRWRMRKLQGHTFSGSRLSPNLWRALPLVLGPDTSLWATHSQAELQAKSDAARSLLKKRHMTIPGANVLWALLNTCGHDRLRALTDRHAATERDRRSGVPDLFLYAIHDASGQPSIPRFVEVKKPGEAVSADQHDEIRFLQSLGLPARVLRLIERPIRDSGRRSGRDEHPAP